MKKRKMNWYKTLDRIVTEIPVSDIMITKVKTLKEEDTVQKAVDQMAKYSIAGLLIVNNEGYPVGIISEGDIIKKVLHKQKNMKKVKLKEVMSRNLLTIETDVSIGETATIMEKQKISKLPVVESRKLVGYVTKSDLLEKLNEIYYQAARLRWAVLFIVVQFIIIAILLMRYINK